MGRLADLQEKGEAFIQPGQGISLEGSRCDAYFCQRPMGGWGVAESLAQGADIVVAAVSRGRLGRDGPAALVVRMAASGMGQTCPAAVCRSYY